VVPVVLGEDANISVTIVANPPPSAYELNKNGELTDSNETKVSPAAAFFYSNFMTVIIYVNISFLNRNDPNHKN